MNRKGLFNILRIVISVGLVVFVCSRIRLNDTLVRKDGTTLTGRLMVSGPERFVIRLDDGHTEQVDADQLLTDDENRSIGVQRGILTVFRDIDLAWFLPTFLIFGAVPTLGAFRFRMLLAVQDVKIRVGRALSLTFLGWFFNNFMLGLTGGDIVKAYYVARDTHKRTEAVVTVFLDRVVGLIAMAILAAAMVALNIGDPRFRSIALYVWVFFIGAGLLVMVIYSHRLRHKLHYATLIVVVVGGGILLVWRWWLKGWTGITWEVLAFLSAVVVLGVVVYTPGLKRVLGVHELRRMLAGNKRVREMDAAFDVFSRRPLVTVVSFVISLACHFITLSAVFGWARSLGIAVEFRYFVVFVPVIVMIAAIPVSMAGWGVQEAVFQVFFGSVGVGATEAITLSFVYRLCASVLWSLPGGVVLMLSRDRASVHEVERAMSEEKALS